MCKNSGKKNASGSKNGFFCAFMGFSEALLTYKEALEVYNAIGEVI